VTAATGFGANTLLGTGVGDTIGFVAVMSGGAGLASEVTDFAMGTGAGATGGLGGGAFQIRRPSQTANPKRTSTPTMAKRL
jgi:hypothetical protein